MSNKFDTAELNDIRRMLGEDIPEPAPVQKAAPAPSAAPRQEAPRPAAKPSAAPTPGSYNLDDILAEVSGVVDKTRAEQEARKPEPPRFTDVASPAAPPARPAREPAPAQKAAPARAAATAADDREAEASEPSAQPARRAARRRADEDEEIVVRDPVKAMHAAQKRVKSLSGRCIPVLLLGLVALYLTVAEGLGLPIPALIRFAESPRLFVLVQIACQIIAMLIGIDVIGLGFYNLVSGHADRASLVALANMAAILHCMSFIIAGWGGVLPYSSICILLLFAAMCEEKNRFAGRARAYKAVTLHETPMGVYCHGDSTDHARRTVKCRMTDRTAFLRELERPDSTERFAKVYAPLALAASIVLSVVVVAANKSYTDFFWALSAMLTITTPLPILCAFGKAYLNVSRRLLSEGAAIAGGRSAFRIRKARRAVLQDGDLFPSGTVSITEVRAHTGYTPEKLLSYAVAVTDGYGMEISKVLAEALREQYGRPARASDIRAYDMGGLSGEIGGDTVLVGTAAYMARMGMPVQEMEAGKGTQSGVYVVINGQPAGVILLAYHANAQTFSALHALIRLGIRPELAARDFNVSPEMIQKMFEIRRGQVGEVAADRLDQVTSSAYVEGDAPCAILSRDGVAPFAQVHQSADKLSGAMRSNLILGAIGGLCGLLLIFYLAFQQQPQAVTPRNLLIYMILWYIPAFFVTFHTRKGL